MIVSLYFFLLTKPVRLLASPLLFMRAGLRFARWLMWLPFLPPSCRRAFPVSQCGEESLWKGHREERTGVSPASGEVLRVAVVVMKESQEVSVLQPGGVSTAETVCLFLLMSAVTG